VTSLNRKSASLKLSVACAALMLGQGVAAAASGTVPTPRARPGSQQPAVSLPAANPGVSAARREASAVPLPPELPATPSAALAAAPATGPVSAGQVAALKQVAAQAGRGNIAQAESALGSVTDPVARKLGEWIILRNDNSTADFARYASFANANPSWPGIAMLRRRAEAMLWTENRRPDIVRGFFARTAPMSARGRLALARALVAEGQHGAAAAYIRQTWREDALPRDLEDQILDAFGNMLTAADHKIRMDERLYADDRDAALRAAARAGAAATAIARARIAVNANAGNAEALLDAVPASARRDAGYLFSRIQWLRRKDQLAEAARLMISAPRDPAEIRDTDDWWVERRLIARNLLDAGDPQTAYRVVRDAATPGRDNYKVDHHFTAGWIALRFLNDPAAALNHFSRLQGIDDENPHAMSRAGYWQARALEALGRQGEARQFYQTAARHGTTYYGQLAHSKLGHQTVALRPPPHISAERRAALGRLEVVRAVELLYAIGERGYVISFVSDLADRTQDIAALALIADITNRNRDARATLLLGRAALNRGHAFENYAFPTNGIPNYQAIGNPVERSVVYAIARQESMFSQDVVSPAKAYGLMQVTPPAGQYIARRTGARYDFNRLRKDAAYNVQMGAAELGNLLEDYNGSYIMTFAGYNAGRGRVKRWIEAYGDPRDPKVDPVDWVERIPFAETRNYVARIMENMQVYRARFGNGRLTIEADLRRGNPPN